MAIWESEKKNDKNTYVVLLDEKCEHVVAYVNPVKAISNDTLVLALQDKGLNAEVREVQPEITNVKL